MTARLRAMLARTIICCRSAPSAPIRLTCAMSSAQASWFAPTVLPLSSVDSPFVPRCCARSCRSWPGLAWHPRIPQGSILTLAPLAWAA